MESGSIIDRAKAMIPILIPLFVSAFRRAEELELRPGGRLLFALALDGAGQNSEYQRMLARLRLEPGCWRGVPGASSWTAPGSCTPSPPPPSWP